MEFLRSTRSGQESIPRCALRGVEPFFGLVKQIIDYDTTDVAFEVILKQGMESNIRNVEVAFVKESRGLNVRGRIPDIEEDRPSFAGVFTGAI